MRRVAIFVDAGYFWVQVINVILGGKAQRNQLAIDYECLRKELLKQTQEEFVGVDILRAYWYDGPGPNGKTPDHRAIEELNDFKLRLGTRNGVGAQKAVDGLIIADMIGLAQSKAISDALLISGDADLTPGVIAAQNLGIRVHLLSMGSAAATSPYLRSEVDFKHHWSDDIVKLFSKAAPIASAPPAAVVPVPSEVAAVAVAEPAPVAALAASPAGPDNALQETAAKVFSEIDKAVAATLKVRDPIPREIDGKLLSECKKILGRSLSEVEKRQARGELRKFFK